MKALVYDGIKELNYRDVPNPQPAENEHLIKVEAVGICGSDMHAYLGHDARRPAPLILGHEAAGTIEGGSRDGTRVTINPLVTCGSCPACMAKRENLCPHREIISMQPREGAYAQYIAMPASNLIEVPSQVSLAKAALAEPLAVGWHAARLALETLHPSAEQNALVIGGGAIGLATTLALHAMGLNDITIVEPNDSRREYLSETCSEQVVSVAEGAFSLIVDAVGYAGTRAIASSLVCAGGVIVHVGLGEDMGGLDIRRMTLQEISFIGTYTYTAQDFQDTTQAIYDGSLGQLNWYETRPLFDGDKAFTDLQNGAVRAPKIILSPWA